MTGLARLTAAQAITTQLAAQQNEDNERFIEDVWGSKAYGAIFVHGNAVEWLAEGMSYK